MLFFYKGNSLKSGIYEIRNRISNKSYIGSAIRFKRRWQGHVHSFINNKQRNKHLQRSFNKSFEELGHDNFIEFHILEVMENSTKLERLIREEYWIKFAQENNINLYNLYLEPTKENKIWSNNPKKTGKKHSIFNKGKTYEDIVGKEKAEIWKIRQGESIKEFYKTEEGKEIKITHSNRIKNKSYEEIYGIKKAEKIRKKISKLRKGKTYEEIFGAEKAKEMKKKQSQAHLKWLEEHPEFLENLSEKMTGENNHFYGKTHTDETKKLISDTQKGKSLEERYGKEKADSIKEKRLKIKLKKLEQCTIKKEKSENSLSGKTYEEIFGIEKAKERKEKISKNKAKTYSGFILLDPNGNQYTQITNLAQFCLKHKLLCSHLHDLLKGIYKNHRGWKIIDIIKTEKEK